MIDKRELRIGNKVSSPKHDLPVATIQGMATNNIVMLEEVKTYDFFSDIDPIPLTAEWLNRLNIKFGEALGHEYPFGENSGIYLTKKQLKAVECSIMVTSDGDEILSHIQYVHQLQNLYFALTGEELKIKETV